MSRDVGLAGFRGVTFRKSAVHDESYIRIIGSDVFHSSAHGTWDKSTNHLNPSTVDHYTVCPLLHL